MSKPVYHIKELILARKKSRNATFNKQNPCCCALLCVNGSTNCPSKQGTSETMHLPLFWKSHCSTCSPVYLILYHVTGSYKGPITTKLLFITARGLYPFSEPNFQDFSRTQIDFSRTLKFRLTPTLPRSQC